MIIDTDDGDVGFLLRTHCVPIFKPGCGGEIDVDAVCLGGCSMQ